MIVINLVDIANSRSSRRRSYSQSSSGSMSSDSDRVLIKRKTKYETKIVK
jgi:hypothetical protein